MAQPRPFVGRVAELRTLTAALAAGGTPAAGPSTMLVAGESGVGKSRLVAEFAARATESGWLVALGRCLDIGDGNLAYAPLVEALRATKPHEPAAAALAGDVGPDRNPTVVDDLYQLTSKQPVLLIVEDLHWADQSTLAVLLRLAMVPIRNLVVSGTLRSDELEGRTRLGTFLAELTRAKAMMRIDLAPFDRDVTRALLEGTTGRALDDAVVDGIFAKSGGNAYISEELAWAAAHDAPVPQSLRETLLARADCLSAAAREIVALLATAARPLRDAELSLACSACAIDDDERAAALREAVARGILVVDSDAAAYDFRHALLREAIYDDLLPCERVRLHNLLAAALEQVFDTPSQRRTTAGERANHWRAAGNASAAFAASLEAADAAEARHGFAEELAHLEDVLMCWGTVADPESISGSSWDDLVARAARAANLCGAHRRAAQHITSIIDEAEQVDDPLRTASLLERRGRYLWAAGDSRHALDDYTRAVTLSQNGPPSAVQAAAVAAHAQALMLLERYRDAAAEAEQAITLAVQCGAHGVEGHARNTLGFAHSHLGELDAGLADLAIAETIAEQVADLDDIYRAILNRSEILGGPANRLEEAVALARWAAAQADEDGLRSDYGASLRSNLAMALFTLGRWHDASDVLDDAFHAAPCEVAAIDVHLARARLCIAAGRDTEAEAHLAAVDALSHDTLDPQCQAPMLAAVAELALWQGRPADAVAPIVAGLRACEGSDDVWFAAPLAQLAEWAAAELTVGGTVPDELDAALDRAREHAQDRWQSSITQMYWQLAHAEASRRNGGSEVMQWADAVQTTATLGQPYLEAYARWRHAEALAHSRRRRKASVELAVAAQLAMSLGARPLLRGITALAECLGTDISGLADARPEEPVESSSFGPLTRREHEVLVLLSHGRTNREIARDLFIALKTAEIHVSRVLAKLHARNRIEAVLAARGRGLLG